VRDGWWDEWYDGGNGWEIPTADGVQDPARRDELEASALYELLAKSVGPLFYEADDAGVPHGWVQMLRHNLRTLGPLVQADRMVSDYVKNLYAPAAASSRALVSDGNTAARDLATWKSRVRQSWSGVRIEHVEADGAEPSLGAVLDVRVLAVLGDLTPSDVCVEVVYGRLGDDDELADPSTATLSPDDTAEAGHTRFSGSVELSEPGPFGYTVRVLPSHPLLTSKPDLGLVTYPDAPAGMSTGDLR
jgi:starch phosphorylase